MMLSRCWWWRVVAVLVWAATAVAVKMDTHKGTPAAGNSRVVQQLESSLLSSFGLKRRPSVKMDVVVPTYMMELFHRQQAKQNEAIKAEPAEPRPPTPTSLNYNTARSFTHAGASLRW